MTDYALIQVLADCQQAGLAFNIGSGIDNVLFQGKCSHQAVANVQA